MARESSGSPRENPCTNPGCNAGYIIVSRSNGAGFSKLKTEPCPRCNAESQRTQFAPFDTIFGTILG